ncbi:type II toxin-antitoxin system toxin DNA ADP-ribosyl transferase DarT [Photorhabdus viridis]|uniref:type II toxin-antitoxin system toxin DNA ADP-ribosyl transferase DarT n=1 Tax=Photorhabdus viridis TaxID=3163327 RepID=UPI00330754A2
MVYDYSDKLNPEKALIWRVVHRDNIPWILDNGLHCGNSPVQAENWVNIGNPELISKRASHPVLVGTGGVLHDYVPFYFTPFSPMLMNILSGRGGIKQRPNDEIVILVSSLHKVAAQNVRFVFTDSHAYYNWSNFYTDLTDLNHVDWRILQERDFKRDPEDPAKFERYQAEALIHQHCPIALLKGMVCYTDAVKLQLEGWLTQRNITMPVYARERWYFS